MPWIIVLGDRTAMEWVIDHGRMAVGPRVKSLPGPGERVVLYTSRGAFHNPTRDRAQVIGLGVTTDEPAQRRLVIAGTAYDRSFGLDIEALAEPRQGLDFASLVPRLDFITKKDTWGGALRRPIVRLSDRDYKMIETAFRKSVPRSARVR